MNDSINQNKNESWSSQWNTIPQKTDGPQTQNQPKVKLVHKIHY